MRCPYFLEWDKEDRSGAGCVCITDGVQRLQTGRRLSNIQIQYCKNNCETCPDFRTARARGVMGVLPNQKSSSGGVGKLFVIGVIIAVVAKYFGIW